MHWNLSSSSWFYKRFAILVHCKFFFFGLASIPVAVGLFLLFFPFCSTLLSYGKIDHLERTVGLLLRFALFFSSSSFYIVFRRRCFRFLFRYLICAKKHVRFCKSKPKCSLFATNNVEHIRWNEHVCFENVCVIFN